jgi:sphinganine-1-phosphate aldolase|tara:strand:+ start:326 stop:664 length:339 start_codon:yes stop_codon:yes gene_type:complete
MGTPHLSVIAFASDVFDIYKVADVMKHLGGWEMARMQRPPCVHICVNVRTAAIADKWLVDLNKAVEMCRGTEAQGIDGMAGIYGQAGIVPDRSVVSEILKGYLDTLLMTRKK